MSTIKQMMSSTAHWPINKKFVEHFGWDAAIMMTHLVDKWSYFDFPEEFYNQVEDAELDIKLSWHKQTNAIKVLVDNGFVVQNNRGTPMRRYFSINEDQILNFFNSSFRKIQKLESEKFENYNPKNSDTLNKNKIQNKEKEQSAHKNFNYDGHLKAMKKDISRLLKKNMDDFDEVVNKVDMSIREICDKFSEYWVIGQEREFSKTNIRGLCSSFRSWIDLVDAPDLRRAQNESHIGKSDNLSHVLSRLKSVGKFEPTASQRQEISFLVNEVDYSTIENAITRFSNSVGMTHEVFLSILKNVIREKEVFK